MPVRYRGNLSTNTLRNPSGAIWSNCPWRPGSGSDGFIDGGMGMPFFDDFTVVGNATMSSAYAGSIGQWSTYGYAGAQLNDNQTEGGVIKIGSDGDNEGMTLLGSAGSYRMVTTSTLALNKKLWFEARVGRSSVAATKGDFFVGLMAPTLASGLPTTAQPITTTDDTLMTAGDLFGFHSCSGSGTRGGPTEWANAFVLASGTVNYPTNGTTMVASTSNTALTANDFVKLGFIFDPKPNAKKLITSATARQTAGNLAFPLVRFFVNGVELPMFLTADDVANATATQAFPTAFMAPVLSVMNTTGSSPPTLLADWIAVYQNGNS